MKYPAIMPAPTPTSLPNARPVLSIKANETNDFVEAPPYPNKVQENLLKAIANKSAKRNYTPYEQIEVRPEVSVIKELNEENPLEVYLCEDATKVLKGRQLELVSLLYLVLLGLLLIMDFVILLGSGGKMPGRRT